ncbi:hypothetical protein N8603_00865 [Verrucomicrobiales bacterium]|nr:hypothetical protein [Verrucomicrobiales bacterium]
MSEEVKRKFLWKLVQEPKASVQTPTNTHGVIHEELMLKVQSGCFATYRTHHTPVELVGDYLDIPTEQMRFFIFRKFERIYLSQLRKIEILDNHTIPYYFSYEVELDFGEIKPKFKAFGHVDLVMCFALILRKNGYRDINLESFCEKLKLDYFVKPEISDNYCVWKQLKRIYHRE